VYNISADDMPTGVCKSTAIENLFKKESTHIGNTTAGIDISNMY